jgi:pimeloyl-ACP methyl ester carboxylesterase
VPGTPWISPHRLSRMAWPVWCACAALRSCLTRNSRDFDVIAEALAAQFRVIAPDMAGRGRSDYLAFPADYDAKLYLSDIAALIARLDVESVDWLGTSMGGTLGILMAATPGNPIRRLVVNDVGPILPKAALERIVSYVGVEVSFPSIEAMEAALRQIYSVFGPMTDAQMRKLTEDSASRRPDGGFGFAYDPHIADPFKATPVAEVNLWPFWDAVTCPILVLRGAVSDVLPRDVADEIIHRKPNAEMVEFAGTGHAPPLLSRDQIATVRDFLTAK